MDTTTSFSRGIPVFSAHHVLAIEPNICCGDLAVDGMSSMSGNWCSKKFTQAGQQDVSIGSRTLLSPSMYLVSLSSISAPSSIIVRSAAKSVSKT